MSKVRVGPNAPGQVLPDLKTPTEQLQERTPQAPAQVQAPPQGTTQPPIVEPEQLSLLEQALKEPATPMRVATPEEQQVQAERVPNVRERATSPDRKRWSFRTADSTMPDGGLSERAQRLVKAFDPEEEGPNIKLGTSIPQNATPEVKAQRVLASALERINALENGSPRRDFIAISSAVVENTMMDYMKGVDLEESMIPNTKKDTDQPDFTKAFSATDINRRVGLEISRELQRLDGKDVTDDVSAQEAVVIGDAMMRSYMFLNNDLVRQIETPSKVSRYQLTPEGMQAFKDSEVERAKLFGRQHVKPLRSEPVDGRLIGESQKLVKPLVVRKGGQTLEDAMHNASSVNHRVDSQRMKIALATILPALMGTGGPLNALYSTMHNFGPAKMQEFLAQQDRQGAENYSADKTMADYKNKIAQHLFGIAEGYGKSNFLTYFMQGFNGRIQPQQALFNPVVSKLVRFVTTSVKPVEIKPNSRQEANLKQMYSTHLLGKVSIDGRMVDGDMLLPNERLRVLEEKTPEMLRKGERLMELVDETMTDDQVGKIMEAIDKGMAIPDEAFPKYKPLALDPEKDADLIKEIASKGEDGPLFVDGLIDFYKYHTQVVQKGKPYYSYFNAYIDGKTNGLATWGMVVGSVAIALKTGVLRNQNMELLDKGDIRDELAEVLLADLENSDLAKEKDNPESQQMYEIAKILFAYRNLNKYTTMTFGYGREIASFRKDIIEYGGILRKAAEAGDPELAPMLANISLDDIADALMPSYTNAIHAVLDPIAIRSRGLMKGVATLAAIADEPFVIKSPTGMDIVLQSPIMTDYEGAEKTNYSVEVNGKRLQRTAVRYTVDKKTAAGVFVETDAEGNVSYSVGRQAINGSVVAPIQSVDAAVVAQTYTGSSWDRLTSASKGTPYLLSIYDAFKMDANGYDVVLEEVNKNWTNSSLDYDMFGEFERATERYIRKIREKVAELDPHKRYDITNGSEFGMVGFLMETEIREGQFGPKRYSKNLDRLLRGAGVIHESRGNLNLANEMNPKKNIEKAEYATGEQIKTFIDILVNELDLSNQFNYLKRQTDANKKKLKSEIEAAGSTVYQYYSH